MRKRQEVQVRNHFEQSNFDHSFEKKKNRSRGVFEQVSFEDHVTNEEVCAMLLMRKSVPCY